MLVPGYYNLSPFGLLLHHFLVVWLPPITREFTSVEVTHVPEQTLSTTAVLVVPEAVIATRRTAQKMTSGD